MHAGRSQEGKEGNKEDQNAGWREARTDTHLNVALCRTSEGIDDDSEDV